MGTARRSRPSNGRCTPKVGHLGDVPLPAPKVGRLLRFAPVALTCALPSVAPCGLPSAVSRAASLAAWVPAKHSTYPLSYEALSRWFWRCARRVGAVAPKVGHPGGAPLPWLSSVGRRFARWGRLALQMIVSPVTDGRLGFGHFSAPTVPRFTSPAHRAGSVVRGASGL